MFVEAYRSLQSYAGRSPWCIGCGASLRASVIVTGRRVHDGGPKPHCRRRHGDALPNQTAPMRRLRPKRFMPSWPNWRRAIDLS